MLPKRNAGWKLTLFCKVELTKNDLVKSSPQDLPTDHRYSKNRKGAAGGLT